MGFSTRAARAGAVLLFLFFGACTWKVVVPEPDNSTAPVFVTAYSKHTRIALPDGQERFIEYGFGDWNYYALEKRGPVSAFRAAFFSPSSAFSRRELAWTEDAESFRRAAGGVRTARIEVPRDRARDLMEELESLWEKLDEERVYREWEDITLARWDHNYHVFRNSNHQAAAWLRELGCETRGWAFLNRFKIEPLPDPEDHSSIEPDRQE